MSAFEKACLTTYVAGADLRNSLYELLALNAAGRVVKADAVTSRVIGVLAEEPDKNVDSTGRAVTVAKINGSDKLLVKAGAAITAGHLVIPSTTDGKAEGVANIAAITTNAMAIGQALQAASAENDVIEVEVMPIFKSA